MKEHESEPVRGLPELLPQGERLLWQGSPDFRALALRALYVRSVLIYFALLFVWSVFMSVRDGASFLDAVWIALRLVPVALAAAIIFGFYAWLAARGTVYTITTRRVVMRFGVALPMTLNIPFTVIGNVAVRVYRDGTGDVPLTLSGGDRVSYIALWPHVRPWRTARPEPMLRAVPNGARVAKILADALAKTLREYSETAVNVDLALDSASEAAVREQAA